MNSEVNGGRIILGFGRESSAAGSDHSRDRKMDETDKRDSNRHEQHESMPAKREGKSQKKGPEKSLRLFIGLAAPIDYGLRPLRERLQSAATEWEEDCRLRFVRKSDLHITLKFLGSLEASRLTAVEQIAAERLAGLGPLELQARDVGLFRNSLWAGIEKDPALDELARTLDEAFVAEGVGGDQKTFLPHVTVARFRAGSRDQVSAAVREFNGRDFGRFYTDRAFLYRSDTRPEGARYTVIKRFHLGSG